MRILFCRLSLVCLVAAGHWSTVLAEGEPSLGAVADVAELKVLDRLRGQWTGKLDHGDAKLKLTSRWILDGHVLESKFQLDGDLHGLFLRTYDAEDGEYVVTYMDAAGSVVLMTGSWDESQQTLTTSGKNGGHTITLTTKFVDERTTQWTITQSTGGSETSRIGGTNRRTGN